MAKLGCNYESVWIPSSCTSSTLYKPNIYTTETQAQTRYGEDQKAAENWGDWVFPSGSDGKESPCNAGDPGLIPGLKRSPGEGRGYPLQYSCLENSMDRGVWHKVHGVAELDMTEQLTFSLSCPKATWWERTYDKDLWQGIKKLGSSPDLQVLDFRPLRRVSTMFLFELPPADSQVLGAKYILVKTTWPVVYPEQKYSYSQPRAFICTGSSSGSKWWLMFLPGLTSNDL